MESSAESRHDHIQDTSLGNPGMCQQDGLLQLGPWKGADLVHHIGSIAWYNWTEESLSSVKLLHFLQQGQRLMSPQGVRSSTRRDNRNQSNGNGRRGSRRPPRPHPGGPCRRSGCTHGCIGTNNGRMFLRYKDNNVVAVSGDPPYPSP
jgi:hypothetical protein